MELINKHQYAIGVVARRTQTHPETIRVWERRYELIVPGRSETGRRLYSENDIAKLTLVKRLTELGHSVSSLAKLSNDDLRDRLNASLASEPSKYTEQLSKLRVVFANDALRLRLSRDLLIHEDITVVDFPNKNASSVMEPRADIVIVDLVTLNEESLSDVRHYLLETRCESALVIFNFGTKKSILELEDAGVVCLKGSVAAAEIYRACRSIKPTLSNSRPALNQPVTSPRFTNEQLSRITGFVNEAVGRGQGQTESCRVDLRQLRNVIGEHTVGDGSELGHQLVEITLHQFGHPASLGGRPCRVGQTRVSA
jgi:DNA-binding transcriptional MerR regulator